MHLFDALTPAEIYDVYDNLNIEVSSINIKPMVSPKSYLSIFRSLYLSSYLKEENSNYVLKILTQTQYNDKIPSKLPSDVVVSHKIGVFKTVNTSEEAYTDCGIVYIPERPYALCIFVKGNDEEAKKHISYISEVIHLYITRVKSDNGI